MQNIKLLSPDYGINEEIKFMKSDVTQNGIYLIFHQMRIFSAIQIKEDESMSNKMHNNKMNQSHKNPIDFIIIPKL